MRGILAMLMAGLLAGGCAAYTATSGRVVLEDGGAVAAPRFSDGDRAAVENYYRQSAAARPAPESIPLLKGGWLPSDVGAVALPAALERKLSTLPSTHARQKVGTNVVLFDRKTRVIADVLHDVVR